MYTTDKEDVERKGIMQIYESYCEEDTLSLAKQLAQKASQGDIFCLIGDLGVGKTIFSKGFAYGIGINEHVTSPTFTIVHEYDEGRLPLYHFDVYRISDSSEMDEIGYEEYFYGKGVCLVEWANLIPEIIPNSAVYIKIEKDLDKGFEYRKITVGSGEEI